MLMYSVLSPLLPGNIVSHHAPVLFLRRVSFRLYITRPWLSVLRDNFRLVVLDEDDEGVDDNARSKAHAAESAKNFLRDRMGSRKRVSHSLFKARKRLGPSPNF